ncbi:MAG: NAD(P)-dependent alcohol dehydrogenase [Chloroflexota bacterium]
MGDVVIIKSGEKKWKEFVHWNSFFGFEEDENLVKAIRYETFGPPELLQLREVPKPVPKGHQVLVKVHAASINALEWRRFTMPLIGLRLISGGWFKPKDTALGTDVAGRVEAVGEEVTRFKPGDEVFGCAHGSFAEFVLARETFLTFKPVNRSFSEAAAMPLAALTALQGIRCAGGIRAAQEVLIQGASGGIGVFAIQLAKNAGAEVTAVCSTRNLNFVLSQGADHVIDYTHENFTKNLKRYDLILAINGYQSLWAYRSALKPQGVYVCVGGSAGQILQALLFSKWFSQKDGKTMKNMGMTIINRGDLTQVSELLQTGTLVPVIDRSYPLTQTAQAFRSILDTHAQGKIIIEVFKD